MRKKKKKTRRFQGLTVQFHLEGGNYLLTSEIDDDSERIEESNDFFFFWLQIDCEADESAQSERAALQDKPSALMLPKRFNALSLVLKEEMQRERAALGVQSISSQCVSKGAIHHPLPVFCSGSDLPRMS